MSYPLDDAFMKLWYFLFLLFFSMPRSLVRKLVYSYKKVNECPSRAWATLSLEQLLSMSMVIPC